MIGAASRKERATGFNSATPKCTTTSRSAPTSDIERLWRFIKGEALGFVACGGGAYCAAHIGIYKAFGEKNIEFDCVGGTSGGAAMAAAFAQNIDAADIDARVHRMFIDGKALARYTLPRYSLLDHTHFDKYLAAEYGEVRIEDMWKPYFAVSMDLSDYAVEVHRSGPVWEAIRASASIPALLPPFYTRDGRMLVDGSVVSNVPIDIMHGLERRTERGCQFQPASGRAFRRRLSEPSCPARTFHAYYEPVCARQACQMRHPPPQSSSAA